MLIHQRELGHVRMVGECLLQHVTAPFQVASCDRGQAGQHAQQRLGLPHHALLLFRSQFGEFERAVARRLHDILAARESTCHKEAYQGNHGQQGKERQPRA